MSLAANISAALRAICFSWVNSSFLASCWVRGAAARPESGCAGRPRAPDNGCRVDAVVPFKPAVLHGNDRVDIGLGQLVTAGKAGPGADLIIEAGNGLLRRCGAVEPPALHTQCSANDHQYKQRRQQQAAEQSLYKTFLASSRSPSVLIQRYPTRFDGRMQVTFL